MKIVPYCLCPARLAGKKRKSLPWLVLCGLYLFFFDGVVVRRDAMHFLREEKRQCKKGQATEKRRTFFALFTTFLLAVILDREGTKRGPPRTPTTRDRADRHPWRLSQYAARA